MTKEKMLLFRTVKVNIPQKFFIKLFNAKRYLTAKESRKISQKLGQIRVGINQLQHAESIGEQIHLRALNKR